MHATRVSITAVLLLQCLILVQAKPLLLQDIVQLIQSAMNTSVNPCDDFYAYSCGGWIASTPLPPDEDAIFKSISGIENNNQLILKSILETGYNGTFQIDDRITTLYDSCMAANNATNAFAPILANFQTWINDINNVGDLMNVAGVLGQYGFSTLFGFGPALDSKNPSMTIAQLTQGGIALPDPSLYTDQNIMLLYKTHVQNMLQLAGVSPADAVIQAQKAVLVETLIANGTTSQSQLQNPFVTYNKIDLAGLIALAPQLPWKLFLAGIEYPQITQINVDVPSFYQKLAENIAPLSPDVWQAYMYWSVVHQSAPYFSDPFVIENFNFFGKVLQGLTEMPPRWENCVAYTDAMMGFLLDKYFVQAAFPGSSKAKASQMIQAIESAMNSNLQQVPWMDNTTRAGALVKLSLVTNDIGYPANWFTYDGLLIEPNTFYSNMLAGLQWNTKFSLDQIEQPSDKSLWEMTPSTVNAYYDPTKNGMVFPAGILQTPYFDQSFAAPIYFGGSGVIMGHELTHGFDDSGRDYDGHGVLTNWWQPATSQKFDQLAGCVIDQFSTFEVLPGVYIDGNLTQGENIADMGGTKLAYLALQNMLGQAGMQNQSVVPGFTNAELFFIAYAQGWCSVQTDESLKLQVETDVHSPARFRVLGPLINHPTFADVWKCPVGSYMNPVDKCAIW